MLKNIELELRAEIKNKDFEKVLSELAKKGKLISKTKRLSVMFFGKNEKNSIDIRIRITNGKAEIVLKSGYFHSHDRIEISQHITKKQFMGMIRIFTQMGFESKVGERQTFNFEFKDNVVASLVKAKTISYLELEKMSSVNDIKKNKKILETVMSELDLKAIKNATEFDELCSRLDNRIDWSFLGTRTNYKKLERILIKY